MRGNEASREVEAVRHFNRFYTKRIGVLGEGLLDSPYPLTEARVIYELAHRDTATAAELCRALAIDAGYLSRILRRFLSRGLIEQHRSSNDRRQRITKLSARGREAFDLLNKRSQAENAGLLEYLDEIDRTRLLSAMTTIESLLGDTPTQSPTVVLRPHEPGDMGWVVQRHGALYSREYGWDDSFEALVARVTADFIDNLDPRNERCWMAELGGTNVGSIFVVKKTQSIAKLRLMIVEPQARGRGIGKRLVEEAIRFAGRVGYRRLTLWTMNVLLPARHIYGAAGFQLVAEEPVHAFGHDLISETWELDLRRRNRR